MVLLSLRIRSIGSSVRLLGRFKVPWRVLKSLGRFNPGISRLTSHSEPTVGALAVGSSPSTITSNGDPLTGLPLLVTSITCCPGSVGVNSKARVLSGLQLHGISSTLRRKLCKKRMVKTNGNRLNCIQENRNEPQ